MSDTSDNRCDYVTGDDYRKALARRDAAERLVNELLTGLGMVRGYLKVGRIELAMDIVETVLRVDKTSDPAPQAWCPKCGGPGRTRSNCSRCAGAGWVPGP